MESISLGTGRDVQAELHLASLKLQTLWLELCWFVTSVSQTGARLGSAWPGPAGGEEKAHCLGLGVHHLGGRTVMGGSEIFLGCCWQYPQLAKPYI